jgi:hypothetical protein
LEDLKRKKEQTRINIDAVVTISSVAFLSLTTAKGCCLCREPEDCGNIECYRAVLGCLQQKEIIKLIEKEAKNKDKKKKMGAPFRLQSNSTRLTKLPISGEIFSISLSLMSSLRS